MLAKIAPKLIVALLVGTSAWLYLSSRPIKHPPGVLVKDPPVQKDIAPTPLPGVEGWSLTAIAEYELRARVLGTKRYYSGPTSSLVPIDVALGWGRMSDQAILDQFSISMTNRFFFYEWSDEPAIPMSEIEVSAANNHIIAANDEVRSLIGSLRVGQIVTMRGYLVNALGPGGGFWNSSTRRNDTGNGACELFYVQSASAVNSLSGEN